MDIMILQEFVSLAETCNFQETAAEMNISQSSLTKHIHKLEEELGVSLFDRSTRTVRLNEYSRTYYPYAKQIVQNHQDSLRALAELDAVSPDEFTIAYMPILGQYGLVDTIADFCMSHKDINLKTIETGHPVDLLKTHKADFVFVSDLNISDEGYNKIIYKSDELAVVVPESDPLARCAYLTVDQIKDRKFILHSSNDETSHEETVKFLKLCEENGFKPDVIAESLFTATIVRYVSAGRGIAVLNKLHVPTEIPNIRMIDLRPSTPSYIYMVYRRKQKAASATQFLHYMIENMND